MKSSKELKGRHVLRKYIVRNKTHELFFQLVLLLRLLQDHVGLRELGVQQLFFQVSVFEDLFQVLKGSL